MRPSECNRGGSDGSDGEIWGTRATLRLRDILSMMEMRLDEAIRAVLQRAGSVQKSPWRQWSCQGDAASDLAGEPELIMKLAEMCGVRNEQR